MLKKWMSSLKAKQGLFLVVLASLILSLSLSLAPLPKVFRNVFYVGMDGIAYGVTLDATCDGDNDDVQVQAILTDNVPATGGEIILLAGAYDFHATVTRAINNVKISGSGRATSITTVGVTAPFTCTGQTGWTFEAFASDDAPAYTTSGSVTSSTIVNGIWVNGVYKCDFPSPETVVRSGAYVVASSGATTIEKAQADYVMTGVAATDTTAVNALCDAADTGMVVFSEGAFSFTGLNVYTSRVIGAGRGSTEVTATSFSCNYTTSVTGASYYTSFGSLNEMTVVASNYTGTGFVDYEVLGDAAGDDHHFRNGDGWHNVNIVNTAANQQGTGFKLAAITTGVYNASITGCTFGPLTICNFETGLHLEASETGASDNEGWINSNFFQDLWIAGCKNPLYLEAVVSGADEGSISGNKFVNVIIDPLSASYDINFGIRMVGHCHSNDFYGVNCWDWTPAVVGAALTVECDSDTLDNHFEGDMYYTYEYETIISDNGTRNMFNGKYLYEWYPICEEKRVEGELTAGVADAFAFAWENPEAYSIIVTRVILFIQTAGGTATSVIDVGSAANATSTNDNLIDGADLNVSYTAYDSIHLNGTNQEDTVIRLSVSGGSVPWITGKILVANASSLAGRYWIYYTVYYPV